MKELNKLVPGPAPRRTTGLRHSLLALLHVFGKTGGKKAAVIGSDPEACHRAVIHIRRGAPDVPIWLFSTKPPLDETASCCERVVVCQGDMALLYQAQRQLWRCSVALSAGSWSGEPGGFALKLAPLLIPPFRSVFLNDNGDFLSGTPANVARHGRRRLREALHNRRVKAGEILDHVGIRTKVVAHDISCRVKDVASGFALLAASAGLRLFGYPDRHVFHRVHGAERAAIPNPAPTGFGVEWFQASGNIWNGAAFENFARSVSSRWIGWSKSGHSGLVRDMFPLMAHEDRFALSRQSCFRQWRSMLFATAPFRALQPGEASQVLAPLSETIIVDRLKLLALGIPKCRMASTAWLLLFWKAAAAGWRSYSVGSTGTIGQEQDFPQQERAFIMGVLANSSLRRLGPSEPGLSRGSIAFFPASGRSFRLVSSGRRSDRLKVLVVSPFLPYPLSHGGAVRMFNLCRALSDRVDFALVARHEHGEAIQYDKLHEVFQEVRIVDIDEAASRERRLPAQVRQHRSSSLREAIRSLSAEWQPDLLQVEYTHMADFREAAGDVPAILVEHDLTFSLYRQLAERDGTGEARREYQRWLEYERGWLRTYDGVWTVSEEDRRSAIREGSRPERTFAVRNGVDTVRFKPSFESTASAEILFVGSFRHLPNLIGFEKLRDEVMPLVWKRCPHAAMRVVAGQNQDAHWRRYAPGRALDGDPRVLVHGFVEDLRPLYDGATAVAVPLEVSAGTNIKVLEAMACGKAIVTTPTGCQGLDLCPGHDLLVRGDWPGFAGALTDILSNSGLRSHIAGHARRTVEQRFSWAAIQEDAYQSYLAILGRRTAVRRPKQIRRSRLSRPSLSRRTPRLHPH